MSLELLYFANPMCSWCWGFAPVIEGVARDYPVTLALGSLGHGRGPMRPQDKAYVREHWEHVTQLTGQPFDFAFFDREGFVYDTEPAARAVAVVRSQRPELTLPYFHALQRAFYAENRDVSDPGELRQLAQGVGAHGDAFAEALAESDAREAVAAEFKQTARLGVTGYPTLLALSQGQAHVVTIGYRPVEDVQAALAALPGAPAAG